MKMLCFGKNRGSFVNDKNEVIEYWKISAVKLSDYVQQINDEQTVVVGGECGKYSCLSMVWDLLPDDAAAYVDGLLLDVDFDEKKKIIDVELV